jgi:transposase
LLGYLWCIVRILINALTVCNLLEQISKIYAGKFVTIILDNAKYQKCALVTELAKNLNIDLLDLPSYSPNLNIIERLWKWTKKDCLNCQYYETFALFKEAIDKSLMKTKNHENTDIPASIFTQPESDRKTLAISEEESYHC